MCSCNMFLVHRVTISGQRKIDLKQFKTASRRTEFKQHQGVEYTGPNASFSTQAALKYRHTSIKCCCEIENIINVSRLMEVIKHYKIVFSLILPSAVSILNLNSGMTVLHLSIAWMLFYSQGKLLCISPYLCYCAFQCTIHSVMYFVGHILC